MPRGACIVMTRAPRGDHLAVHVSRAVGPGSMRAPRGDFRITSRWPFWPLKGPPRGDLNHLAGYASNFKVRCVPREVLTSRGTYCPVTSSRARAPRGCRLTGYISRRSATGYASRKGATSRNLTRASPWSSYNTFGVVKSFAPLARNSFSPEGRELDQWKLMAGSLWPAPSRPRPTSFPWRNPRSPSGETAEFFVVRRAPCRCGKMGEARGVQSFRGGENLSFRGTSWSLAGCRSGSQSLAGPGWPRGALTRVPPMCAPRGDCRAAKSFSKTFLVNEFSNKLLFLNNLFSNKLLFLNNLFKFETH